jgi:hypothetical protein
METRPDPQISYLAHFAGIAGTAGTDSTAPASHLTITVLPYYIITSTFLLRVEELNTRNTRNTRKIILVHLVQVYSFDP